MLTDVDKEFDTPIKDENGELIEVIELEEVFEDDTGLEEKEDSFYETEDGITQEVEEFNSIEEDIVLGKESYEEAKQQLVDIFTSILEKGEITAEDNIEIEQVKEQYSEAYNSIKENTENVQKKTLEERLEELKEGMVGATTDDILNILTEGGTKCWLYKDDDGNVLMDGTAIPELTILVQKFNLIATDGENESEIQLTPKFIDMVSKDIMISADNITLEGLVTANDNFKILSDGSIVAKNGTFEGNINGGTININNAFKVSADGTGTFDAQVICKNLYAGYLRCTEGLQIKTPNDTWSTIAKYDESAGRIRFGYGAYADGRNVWYDGGDYVKVRARERLELTCKSWDVDAETKYSAYLQYYFGTDGNIVITFRPAMDNNMLLGSSSNRWKRIYSVEALNVSSDRNAKENIEYIDPNNVNAVSSNINLNDMYNFVKNEIYLAKFNYKDSNKDTIGFIAQDLLEVDAGNSKAYDIANIVANVDEEKKLSYDTGAYINVLAGALKQAILKIEKLEDIINESN